MANEPQKTMGQNTELKRLHALQLTLLTACIDIFERHGLQYFLLGGSALGAVRHQGFIPWDDDIDIGMPRADYERFLSIANRELEPHLFLQTWDTDQGYPLQFAKLRDSTTTFMQKSVAHLAMNHGISLDLFPLDGCTSSRFFSNIQFFVFKALRSLYQHKCGMKSNNRLSAAAKAASNILPKSFLKYTIERLMLSSHYDSSTYVINWCGSWGTREIVERAVFGKGKKLSFEGMAVTVPKDVESYLTSLYGDYMRLPPEEKRVRPHATDIIDLDRSFVTYQKTLS